MGTHPALVGETKYVRELERDLHRKFWREWNSAQRFAVKPSDFPLVHHLPPGTDSLSDYALGWLDVTWGQLRAIARTADFSECWLIYECSGRHAPSLLEALEFLSRHDRTLSDTPEHFDPIGFCRIEFLQNIDQSLP